MLLVIFTDNNFVEQDPPPFVLPYTRFLENIIYVKASLAQINSARCIENGWVNLNSKLRNVLQHFFQDCTFSVYMSSCQLWLHSEKRARII